MTGTARALASQGRIAASGRPFEDPGCAGCEHLPLLRALRRAGLAVEGGLGCEPPSAAEPFAPPGRIARVAGAVDAVLRAPALVAERPALVAVADRGPQRAAAVDVALAAAGARVVHLPPGATVADAERAVAAGLADPGAVLVSIVRCARGREPGPPREVHPARCNRCGSCLALGCVAISDPGGEAMAIDASRCRGCGQCAALCRGRAIVPRPTAADALVAPELRERRASRKPAY